MSNSDKFNLEHACRMIFAETGDLVRINQKAKSLYKFGRHTAVGTSRESLTLLQGTETLLTYPTTNSIDRVVSDDASYTGTVTIEGHTIADGLLTFVTQDAILNGTTAVTLTTPLARAIRITYKTPVAMAANKKVYVYENVATTAGVPNTAANTKLILDSNFGGSQKAATSISNSDYLIITGIFFSLKGATGSGKHASIELRSRKVGTTNFPFRTIFEDTIRTDGTSSLNFCSPHTYFIIPRNSDVELQLTASAAGVEVTGGFFGYFAEVVTDSAARLKGVTL